MGCIDTSGDIPAKNNLYLLDNLKGRRFRHRCKDNHNIDLKEYFDILFESFQNYLIIVDDLI
jgi:hypothetical protein